MLRVKTQKAQKFPAFFFLLFLGNHTEENEMKTVLQSPEKERRTDDGVCGAVDEPLGDISLLDDKSA